MRRIEVKKIEKDDFEIYKSLRIRALTEAPYAFGETLDNARIKPIDWYRSEAIRWSKSEVSTVFLAFNQKTAIGLVGAFFEKETNRSFICSMWVDPEFRGISVGNSMVAKATNWLKERGGTSVNAWVAESNNSAIRFYKFLGFVATNEKEVLPSNPEESEMLFICD